MEPMYFALFTLFIFIFGIVIGHTIKIKISQDIEEERRNNKMIIETGIETQLAQQIAHIVTTSFSERNTEIVDDIRKN